MFTGIVESTTQINRLEKNGSVYQILVQKPESFDDLKIGDSIAVNGVCLTVEKFDNQTIEFAIGPETLSITKWENSLQKDMLMNLERSLRFGDRVHGHLVTGHVDGIGQIVDTLNNDGTLFFAVQIPDEFKKYVWKKGSLCVSGVSLTVNEVDGDVVSFYLIPETLKKTNLRDIKAGDLVNLEFDYMAKAAIHFQEMSRQEMSGEKMTGQEM
ncbi:MAG: riboflavin synthase [Bdellovibrionota bacterium]